MIKCLYCEKPFINTVWNKKYCSYSCNNKARNLIKMKELFKLTPEQQIIRKRLKEMKKDENL